MRTVRTDIRSRRRGQIVEAAVAVIAEQGLQNLSLSEIENKTGMRRGQLTYYFKAKEEILLAVFDRMLQLMCQRIGPAAEGWPADFWGRLEHILGRLLGGRTPMAREFACLQYTFLAQMGHREDYRRRLADLYDEWRGHMARDLAAELARSPDAPRVSPRTLAAFVQAILHGLGMQLAADPAAFSREEMLELCLDVLRTYLERRPARRQATARKKVSANGTSARSKARNPTTPREGVS
jgi:AcrR family transcriptional regulator